MTGRTPVEAAQRLRQSFQQALSCVTAGVVVVSRDPSGTSSLLHELSLSNISLRLAANDRIALTSRCRYLMIADASALWRTHVAAYFFAVDDLQGREILAHHWHPEGASHEIEPHLHLGAGAGLGRRELVKGHLPTGYIVLPDVLRFLIRDFGVRALRPDWAAVLQRAKVAMTS
ncbi:MAG: hypothetical protein ACRDJE_20925, partial [Dehalococcoidia bacterium]